MKIADIWNEIEILDNIHIPAINKTYPVFEKSEDALKLRDIENALNGYWIMTKRFNYDIEIIR